MAHFAKLDENNIVIDVNVVNNDVLNSNYEEDSGIQFLTEWSGGYTNWKQTSYNRSFRKNFAGIGYTYDPIKDAFIPPQIFSKWILNEETCVWEPPIPCPSDDDNFYEWDDDSESWIVIE